jgi:hypothetical protein
MAVQMTKRKTTAQGYRLITVKETCCVEPETLAERGGHVPAHDLTRARNTTRAATPLFGSGLLRPCSSRCSTSKAVAPDHTLVGGVMVLRMGAPVLCHARIPHSEELRTDPQDPRSFLPLSSELLDPMRATCWRKVRLQLGVDYRKVRLQLGVN